MLIVKNLSLNKILLAFLFGSLLLFTTNGCGEKKEEPKQKSEIKMEKQEPQENEIWIENNSFNPSEMEVLNGTDVTWINKDSVNHRVVSGTEPVVLFDSGIIEPGKSFTYGFTKIGQRTFHCTIHTESTGKVIVQNEEIKELIQE